MTRAMKWIAKVDRQAALTFNRKITLAMKRGTVDKNDFNSLFHPSLHALNSFYWVKSPQGCDYWGNVWEKVCHAVL